MKSTVNNGKHLFGAIIGDIAGSAYEFSHRKDYDFEFFPAHCDFTDDTILTCATADAILNDGLHCDAMSFAKSYFYYANAYRSPMGGYGASFSRWILAKTLRPYNSMGNGAAMRVSPCAYASEDFNICLDLATLSAAVTHNHWQGIRSAQAVVTAIWHLNHGYSADQVLAILEDQFCYDKLRFYVKHADLFSAYRNDYEYTELAEPTVVAALICALTATSFEDAIRRAVSLGGDADTLAAIAGSVAEARFEIPDAMIEFATKKMPKLLLEIVTDFNTKI